MRIPRVCLILAALAALAAAQAPTPNAPFMQDDAVEAVLRPELSDEFDGPLDPAKWSVHGIENPDTKCPKWNGPPSTTHPDYSVYYATSTDAATGIANGHASHAVVDGELNLFVERKPADFFAQREYYCNATTYKCNHDDSIDCFPTKFDGSPNYKNKALGTYWGIVHDKCKVEPYCIPSPEHVTRKAPVYNSFVGPHLATRATMRYGFIETRVLVPPTAALLAVWMHSDQYVNGYCRYKKGPTDRWNVHECPSAIRSRRWAELDVLEAINSPKLARRYVPNAHVFSDHKGEFSDVAAGSNDAGQMGGGPIVTLENEFNLRHPSFSDVPTSERVGNDFHWNPGSVTELDADWAAGYRTVGMYWSPQEIRFYIDGAEVRSIKNTLVHIPMQIDISMAFNVNWAGSPPTEVERHVGKVDYVRVWDINTEDGYEIPYEKEESEFDFSAMVRKFDERYGRSMGGAFGRFPAMDAYTVTPLDQAVRLVTANDTALYLQQMSPVVRQGNAARRARRRERGTRRRNRRRRLRRLRRAGGPGNRGRLRRRRRRNRRQRNILLSNPGRVAQQIAPGRLASTIADAERSAFDDNNVNANAAGWATAEGEGKDKDLA